MSSWCSAQVNTTYNSTADNTATTTEAWPPRFSTDWLSLHKPKQEGEGGHQAHLSNTNKQCYLCLRQLVTGEPVTLMVCPLMHERPLTSRSSSDCGADVDMAADWDVVITVPWNLVEPNELVVATAVDSNEAFVEALGENWIAVARPREHFDFGIVLLNVRM